MNKRHYEHTLPNIRGSLSNTYAGKFANDPCLLFPPDFKYPESI